MHLKATDPGARRYRVFDAETGEEFKLVTEVNTDEGWLIRVVTNENGHIISDGDEIRLERIERAIRVEELPAV